uniref:Diadenosine tetraphosphate hydrolase n=1 Tax=Clandestinovirus TaxID=2831644 RepID=A0A8F8KUI1_9VIRU|nr:diadenosine tetraphosphate hydrolase [Clandestinovirus]
MQEQHDIEETDENVERSSSFKKEESSPNRPFTPQRYHVNRLSEDQCKRFKAAGVLVLAKEPGYHGKTVMLLGKENRTKNKRRAIHKPYWLHFSGKREIEDQGCPQVTALRELHEETAGSLAKYWPMIVEQVYHDSSAKIWDESSCYVLFVVYLPYPDPEIPTVFRYIKDEFQPPENYQTELGWVSYHHVVFDKKYKRCYLRTPGQEEVEIYPYFALYLRTKCIRYILTTANRPNYRHFSIHRQSYSY